MIFVHLLNLLSGYVSFRAWGGFPERFINLCSLNGIHLSNLKADKNALTACTGISSYLRIRQCAVRSGMRLKITGRYGLPFFADKYRRRIGVPIGLMIFFIIIFVLSASVWTIDIDGNAKTSDSEILEVFEQAGLKPGTLRSRINAPEIRFYALSRLDNVTYITVNVIGSCVKVQVTERTPQPPIPDDPTPCDVVSAVDGQIAVLEVYEGTKMYKVGEAVRAGDVLAGGFVELADGSVRLRHAEAYAIITTLRQIKSADFQPLPAQSCTEREKHITLQFFGIRIPLFIDNGQKPDSVRHFAPVIAGRQLPIGFTQEIYYSYSTVEEKNDPWKEQLIITENYFTEKLNSLGGSKTTEETVELAGKEISASFTVQMSAAIAREMLIEQENGLP